MENDNQFEYTRRSKTYMSHDKSRRLLCVIYAQSPLPPLPERCVTRCISECERFCEERLVESVPEGGFFSYKLRLSARREGKRLVLTASATLSDKHTFRTLSNSERKFKFLL